MDYLHRFNKNIIYILLFVIISINIYACSRNLNYGTMQITNPNVFVNEKFRIAFSISISGDRKHVSVDKIIEDADLDFKFDPSMLEYVSSYAIYSADEFLYDDAKLKNNELIGEVAEGSLKIENLKGREN